MSHIINYYECYTVLVRFFGSGAVMWWRHSPTTLPRLNCSDSIFSSLSKKRRRLFIVPVRYSFSLTTTKKIKNKCNWKDEERRLLSSHYAIRYYTKDCQDLSLHMQMCACNVPLIVCHQTKNREKETRDLNHPWNNTHKKIEEEENNPQNGWWGHCATTENPPTTNIFRNKIIMKEKKEEDEMVV